MTANPTSELLKQYIKENNLRSTTERNNILSEILNLPGHFNAEELYKTLKRKNERIVLATVYNTLDLLVSAGILAKYRLGADHTYYEKAIDKPGHHHLVCLMCGEIIEFVADPLSDYEMRIAKKNNFQIQNSTHQIFGKCQKCQS
jgi:Fur family transcriptional regulator, ferric uptake regulator